MDRRTLRAYEENAAEIARRHAGLPHGIRRHFALAFRPGDRLLDVGAGSGRDLAWLLRGGHQVYGLEPVAAMREEAVRLHPELDGRLFEGTLPDGLPSVEALGGSFDGILCSAVLQHLPRSALSDAALALRRLLRPGGRALVSVPTYRTDVGEDGRDPLGRLFSGVAAGELERIFERAGFHVLSRSEDRDPDRDVRWAVAIFELVG